MKGDLLTWALVGLGAYVLVSKPNITALGLPILSVGSNNPGYSSGVTSGNTNPPISPVVNQAVTSSQSSFNLGNMLASAAYWFTPLGPLTELKSSVQHLASQGFS